ncbi:MAG: hypothetical protein ABJA80_11760 [bacterium]
MIRPDGAAAVKTLSAAGQTREFVANPYRHGTTILALSASSALLTRAGIPARAADAGLLPMDADDRSAATGFMAALAMHRHPERGRDPPEV